MKKAIVVYRSHSGVTRRYGEEIAAFLNGKGVAAQVVSVGECDMSILAAADAAALERFVSWDPISGLSGSDPRPGSRRS